MKTTKLLFGILSITAGLATQIQAEFAYSDNGDGTCTITNYTGPPWAVTIPTNINGLTVTSIGAFAFTLGEVGWNVTSVMIPDSVMSIGDNAFFDTPLESVTIGNGVTNIGFDAFASCSSLKSVIMGTNVLSIGYNANGA
jgi:hypothetical protein